MSGDERIRLALLAPRGAHLLQPDSQVIERPGWYQVFTPSVPDGALNEVVRCEALGSAAEADAAIAAEVERHTRAGVPLKWIVGPTVRVPDLGARLEQAGFTTRWAARAMGTVPALGAIELPAGVSVEEVRDERARAGWAAVTAAGWGQDPARAHADAERALAGGRHRLFLSRVDGQPAGAAATFLARPDAPAGYLTGAVVLPAARGRGLYRALVAARLADLARDGIPLAVTQARDHSSAPILGRLGWETLFQFQVYLRP